MFFTFPEYTKETVVKPHQIGESVVGSLVPDSFDTDHFQRIFIFLRQKKKW
jgi:hypothetical protein